MKNSSSNLRIALLSSLIAISILGCSTNNSERGGVNEPNRSGKDIALQTCAMCHGSTGVSISPEFPKLAGQQKDYLMTQLIDFKGHQRKDPEGEAYMWGNTHLTPTQIQELSNYFSSQTPMQGQANNRLNLARGELIFKFGLPDSSVISCAACHGEKGEGNGIFPRIAGQHAHYLVAQIKVFQKTEERPHGAPMKQVTHDLQDADIEAVANYIASMNPM